jgi:F0F1-type ATP synthase assembly protein I
MSQSNLPPEPSKQKQTANNFAVYSIGGQVGCAILGIILLALFIGLGLDKLFGTTKHPFTVLLILGSVPLSLYLTYLLTMRAVKSITPQEPAATQSKPVEEEEKRE